MKCGIRVGALWAIVASASVGCGPSLATTHNALPSAETDQQSTCKVAKDPLHPLVIEWPATAKTALQTTSQRNIVVVSFAGCSMKVLDGCDAGGSYSFQRATPAVEQLQIDSEDKLFAELPLAVASLRGQIQRGAKLNLRYVSVGQQVADGEPLALQGSCSGATHYVRAITVGAYAWSGSASHAAEASAGVAGVGAGAGTTGTQGAFRGSGDPVACEADPDKKECQGILQLSLEPLPQRSASEPQRIGFGTGLGGFAPLPTVGRMREVDDGTELAKTDVALLELVQSAKRLDKQSDVDGEQKHKAWAAVAAYGGRNPFTDAAQERARAWALVGEAEGERIKKAAQVCSRRAGDGAKLNKLLAMDDDIVPAARKAGYQKEYDRAYLPFKEVLKDCEVWQAKAAEPWVEEVVARAARRAQQEQWEQEGKRADGARRAQEAREQQTEARNAPVMRWKTAGMVTGGVLFTAGAAAFITGAAKSKSATGSCTDGLCPTSVEGEVNTANLLGNLGLAGMGVGAVVFAGALLWPVATAVPSQQGQLRMRPGPGDVGLSTAVSF